MNKYTRKQHINKGLLKSLKKEMKNTSSKALFAAIQKKLNSTLLAGPLLQRYIILTCLGVENSVGKHVNSCD